MNNLVKNSIESRKNAIFNAYDIVDESMVEKINNLFGRINELGEECCDLMDFENRFAASQLNQEYIQLFTEIAINCSQKVRESSENADIKSDEEYVLEDLASEVRYQADDLTMPVRRKVRQEAYDAARDMPVIGDIMYVKQHVDLLGRFRKKKKDEDEEDNKGE